MASKPGATALEVVSFVVGAAILLFAGLAYIGYSIAGSNDLAGLLSVEIPACLIAIVFLVLGRAVMRGAGSATPRTGPRPPPPGNPGPS